MTAVEGVIESAAARTVSGYDRFSPRLIDRNAGAMKRVQACFEVLAEEVKNGEWGSDLSAQDEPRMVADKGLRFTMTPKRSCLERQGIKTLQFDAPVSHRGDEGGDIRPGGGNNGTHDFRLAE